MKLVTRYIHVAFTFLGISGIALSFMPFTYDQIPLDVLVNEPLTSAIWCLVVPCVLLPLAVTVGYATWLISGYLPQWLVSTNYALAALSVFSGLAGLGGEGPYEPELMAMLLLFVIGFGSAAWLSMGDVARIPAVRNLVMMQCIYIVPMAFWVTFAQKDFQIGAWLGAVTLLTYLAQISMAVKSRWQMVAVILPVAGIISFGTITRQFW